MLAQENFSDLDIAKLKIEYRSVEKLTEYAGNSRTHSADQVAQLAASMREYGFTNPLLIDVNSILIAGHGRLMAAKLAGIEQVPCIELGHLTDEQRRAYVIADNQLAELSGWDEAALASELSKLQLAGYDIGLTGFDDDFLSGLLADSVAQGLTDKDETPEPEKDAAQIVSVTGDVWALGSHRVMCGDSTSAADVEKLMCGEIASLIHADPPYGMGKQSAGVANDNLYREELDAFQMKWWRVFRQYLIENGSAYIWGNAPDLWRLWYEGGLCDSEYIDLRNEIVWDKKSTPGIRSEVRQKYSSVTERCLFMQIGKQFLGNVNSEDYWEGWDEVRLYLKQQAIDCGLNASQVIKVCGVQMYSHWFTKSQWSLIPEKHYQALAAEFVGYFEKPYKELRAKYDEIKAGFRNHVNDIQGGMRSYFNNTHDAMTDVWDFSRVVGEERHGHATPKPVAMMERVMLTSLQRDEILAEPFGGSGSTLMGAETTGRICYTMEMQPVYVDVIVKRWQNFTGKQAVLENDGRSFSEMEGYRVGN